MAGHFASSQGEKSELNDDESASNDEDGGSDVEEKQGVEGHLGDLGPENGPPSLSSIVLAATPGIRKLYVHVYCIYTYYVSLLQKDSIQKTSTS